MLDCIQLQRLYPPKRDITDAVSLLHQLRQAIRPWGRFLRVMRHARRRAARSIIARPGDVSERAHLHAGLQYSSTLPAQRTLRLPAQRTFCARRPGALHARWTFRAGCPTAVPQKPNQKTSRLAWWLPRNHAGGDCAAGDLTHLRHHLGPSDLLLHRPDRAGGHYPGHHGRRTPDPAPDPARNRRLRVPGGECSGSPWRRRIRPALSRRSHLSITAKFQPDPLPVHTGIDGWRTLRRPLPVLHPAVFRRLVRHAEHRRDNSRGTGAAVPPLALDPLLWLAQHH